jgi:hypothetical protein
MSEASLSERLSSYPFVPLAVSFALFTIYLSTYNGLFHSIDELAMFSLAESLVQTRSTETPQLLFAPYHNPVGRIEPLQSLISIPLYWIALRLSKVGNIQVVMLTNMFLTAATGGLLYSIIKNLGYPVKEGVKISLIYGLGTISWPYTKTFFREPLLAFTYVLAFLCFVLWRNSSQLRFLFLCLALLVVSIVAKLASFAILSVYAVVILLSPPIAWRRRILPLAGLLAFGVALFIGMTIFRYDDFAIIQRFISPISLEQLFIRIYGLLLSPAKGLFIYSPALLLGLLGLPCFWPKRKAESILIIGTFAASLGVYSQWDIWYGGLCLGPRFLLPIVPLLLIPAVEALKIRAIVWRAFSFSILLASISIQLVASTMAYPARYDEVFRVRPESVWEGITSLTISPLKELFIEYHPRNFDLIWLHLSSQGKVYFDGLLFFALVALLGISIAFLVYSLRKRCFDFRSFGVGTLLAISIALGATFLLAQSFSRTRGYDGINTEEMIEIAKHVNSELHQPRIIVTVSNEFHYCLIMNYFKGSFVHYWLSPEQREGFESIFHPPLPAEMLWLVVDRVHMQPGQSGKEIEWWLNRNLYRFDSDWVGGYEVFRYVYPKGPMAKRKVSYIWGEAIELIEFAKMEEVVKEGEALRLEFVFKCKEEIGEDYVFFVHLISPEGRTIDGHDGEPQYGAAPTSSWEEGEVILDRRAFMIPKGIPSGDYSIEIGFYDSNGRLPVKARGEAIFQKEVIIGKVRITE